MKLDFSTPETRTNIQIYLNENQALLLVAVAKREHVSKAAAARVLLIAAINEYAETNALTARTEPSAPDLTNKKESL